MILIYLPDRNQENRGQEQHRTTPLENGDKPIQHHRISVEQKNKE